MRALVIGAGGTLGGALIEYMRGRALPVTGTVRVDVLGGRTFELDLSHPLPADLPPADIIFMCAAVTGFKGARGDEAYRVNVDAQIEIIDYARRKGALPVFISSDAVEYEGAAAYAQQKLTVESYMRTGDGLIVRAGKIDEDRRVDFCRDVVEAAWALAKRGIRKGAIRWR